MKILIADDDKLIRFSLKSMLTEILVSECLITEAGNGEEMINRCMEYEPDIAFVDIRMPNLNGIAAIEACKKFSPYTEFIVLTGYSDFEYAKKCISLGVSDYILKPVEPDYLKTTIDKLSETLSKRNLQKNSVFQLSMHEYFNSPSHNIPSPLENNVMLQSSESFLLFTIFIDTRNTHDIYNQIHSSLFTTLKSFCNKLIPQNIYYSITHSPEGYLRVIFKAGQNQADYLCKRTEQICKSQSTPDAHIYLLYAVSKSLSEIYKNCELTDEYHYIRLGIPSEKAFNFGELDFTKFPLDFYRNLYLLISAFLEADAILYTKSLNTICMNYNTNDAFFPLPVISSYVKFVTGYSANTEDLKSFLKSFVCLSDEMYHNLDCKSNEKIDLITQYINHSYMNDISINQIADRFNLTPNYVSRLFHDKTNTKFIDYLTNLRITHAKKLLISNYDTPVKDIALMVGYYSSRHFSSIFRKQTGYLPTDYRLKYANSNSETNY